MNLEKYKNKAIAIGILLAMLCLIFLVNNHTVGLLMEVVGTIVTVVGAIYLFCYYIER